MTQEHPITPPPELVQEWSCDCPLTDPFNRELYVATHAARWGADEELQACINWLYENGWGQAVDGLRAARRPKPPSLKEQLSKVLDRVPGPGADAAYLRQWSSAESASLVEIIRRALESLPD